MIVDNLRNASNYYCLHPLYKKAFEFIRKLDLHNMETGTLEVEGDQWRISVVETRLKSATNAKIETHKKFIDIQLPITAVETFGWKSLASLSQQTDDYDIEKDIEFFEDKPSTFVTLMPGEFVIFSPEDGHAALIGEGEIKKMIIKIAVP